MYILLNKKKNLVDYTCSKNQSFQLFSFLKLRTIFGKKKVYVGLLICHFICSNYLVHLFLCYLTSRPRCSLALEFICISFRRLISLSLIRFSCHCHSLPFLWFSFVIFILSLFRCAHSFHLTPGSLVQLPSLHNHPNLVPSPHHLILWLVSYSIGFLHFS